MTKQERGDRVWAKKNAAATLNLVLDIARLVGVEHGAAGASTSDLNLSQEEIDRLIRDADREVRRFIKGDKAN